jgi:uncharacterized protein YjeT (DUF2065 family)
MGAMMALKAVMAVQAVVLLAYGLPYFLLPRWTAAITQQPLPPETYILRALGLAFVVLGLLELRILGDLDRHRDLTIFYVLLPAVYCVTIVAQAFVRGFHGALWYWWLNGIVTGVFAVAVYAAGWEAKA